MHIVLGRFQPLHFGHTRLIEKALRFGATTIAIGSSQASFEEQNPWSCEEREGMIRAWLEGRTAKIVHIEDIHDPPNWVSHAKEIHGDGIILTSDKNTAELYLSAGFDVITTDLEERDLLEGWRIRKTLTMLSTVSDANAIREVMKSMLPPLVIDWIIEHDALHRLSIIEANRPHVG